MNKPTLNNKGFGLLGVLAVIIVLCAAGGAGAYVYHHNHKAKVTTTNSSITKKNTTPKTNTGSTTASSSQNYTSKIGGFTISYPQSWSITGYTGHQYNTSKIPASQLTGDENSVLLTSSNSKSDSFGIWLTTGSSNSSASSLNSALTQIPYNQGAIIKILSNGIAIWEANQSLTTNGHTNPNTCTPFETVANSAFGFKLNNGKYLDASMSFCYAQGQTTTHTYDQQASSIEFQQALTILSSLKQ